MTDVFGPDLAGAASDDDSEITADELAQLREQLFGSAPDVPHDVRAAMFEQTFSAEGVAHLDDLLPDIGHTEPFDSALDDPAETAEIGHDPLEPTTFEHNASEHHVDPATDHPADDAPTDHLGSEW